MIAFSDEDWTEIRNTYRMIEEWSADVEIPSPLLALLFGLGQRLDKQLYVVS